MVGMVGLLPTLAAIEAGKDIARQLEQEGAIDAATSTAVWNWFNDRQPEIWRYGDDTASANWVASDDQAEADRAELYEQADQSWSEYYRGDE